jgi:hypothetical protein
MTENAAATEDHPEPAPSPGEHAFKVVPLKLDEQGMPALWGKRHTLSAKVYDRKTAIKYAIHEAQQVSSASLAELLFAVVSPNGRCVAVLAGGTGKPVRPLIALRTKRVLVALMPDEVKVRRRTSRPLTARRRRSSR